MWGRVAIIFCVLFNAAMGVMVLTMLAGGGTIQVIGGPLPPPNQPIEYKDFISILLTALGVMIAAATILVAAAAIWGFEFLKREASATAEREARKVAETTAERVARETAAPVAARTAREVILTQTTAEEAEELAGAQDASEGEEHHGQ